MEESKLARKKNKTVNLYVLGLLALVLGGLAIAAALHQPSDAEAGQGRISDRSKICMLQDTVQSRSGLTYVYQGKKYYLCCSGCLAAFQRDAATLSHARDPVDGSDVDKANAPAYAYQGHAYYFASAWNLATFAKEPGKFVLSR